MPAAHYLCLLTNSMPYPFDGSFFFFSSGKTCRYIKQSCYVQRRGIEPTSLQASSQSKQTLRPRKKIYCVDHGPFMSELILGAEKGKYWDPQTTSQANERVLSLRKTTSLCTVQWNEKSICLHNHNIIKQPS